ncbi:uncharacterized protein LOC113371593 [Ctenocephalides felis]|uniref:uncharacterized protein LOC113371593 n=1 Tax=Ctenocephalides felis TaxID=7515 RepID=UPI000E6E56FD|nr:uncharacterized protein LOC113371593 [Ctenocephalides felis]XP_026468013.1 uncharacterized protein LOC113371593 [Ctenocephalides felis]
MKLAIIILGFLAVAASAGRVSLNRDVSSLVAYSKLRGLQRGALEDKILAIVECLRKILREGGELTGGKVLDPLDAEHLDTNFEIPDLATVNGGLDNLHVSGLSSFNFTSLKLNLVLLKVDYNVTIEQIKATGLYDIVGKLVNLVPISGKGPFDVQLDQITAAGHIKLRLKDLTYLELAEVKLLLSVGAMNFQIDGLMNNPDLSEMINAILNDVLPDLLVENQQNISTGVDTIAKQILNPVLSKLTLQDILDMIGGGGGEGGLVC